MHETQGNADYVCMCDVGSSLLFLLPVRNLYWRVVTSGYLDLFLTYMSVGGS